ncbi:MAG TPA: SRPBCC domain-containing protein [Candidatus Limnocylindrales bacterium]|nr:SRPBCC domain-containing protein [Candidatus Limnocylindrales bacterium]
MRYFEATSTIDAPADKIWSVLAHAQAWPNWDSGVDEVKGNIAAGARITIRSKAAPGRAFPVKVTAIEPPRRLEFTGGMPLGLFKGVRTYSLSPNADGATVFTMREEYTGPLLGLIWKSIPDLGPSFVQFAEGLKKRVESGQ